MRERRHVHGFKLLRALRPKFRQPVYVFACVGCSHVKTIPTRRFWK